MADPIKYIKPVVKEWVKATANGKASKWWFEDTDVPALIKLCARKEVMDALKRLIKKPHFPGDWAPLKSQADYMAQLEAGLRARFRSRLDCLGSSAGGQQSALLSYVNDVLLKVGAFTAPPE